MSQRQQNPRRMRNQPNHHHQQHHRYHQRQHHNQHQSMRLQDFLNHRTDFPLNKIERFVCEFCQDRDGSKFIQRKLDEAPDHRKNRIFEEIHADLHTLMMHCFANFVVQKFFVIGNLEQRQKLYDHIKANFLELSLDKYGCRVVQKAVETALPYQLAGLLGQFTELNIIRLVLDSNGNHVIQNIFRTAAVAPNRHIQDVLFQRIENHVLELCYHLYGCRVIQCILQHGSGTHRNSIFNQIWNNLEEVILNRYGNYVVQNLTSHCSPPHQNRLIQFVFDNVVEFSTNKYASNVVETCISLATPEQRHQVMQTICDIEEYDLYRFCVDASANYVVQKLIETASPDHIDTLVEKITKHINAMERYVCGRKIIDKLKSHQNHRMMNRLPLEFEALWI